MLVVVVICRYVYLTCSSAAREHSRCPCFVRAYLAICNHVRFSHLLCDFASTAYAITKRCVCLLPLTLLSFYLYLFPFSPYAFRLYCLGAGCIFFTFSVSYFSTHMFNRIRPPEYSGYKFFSTLPFDQLFFQSRYVNSMPDTFGLIYSLFYCFSFLIDFHMHEMAGTNMWLCVCS